MQRGVNRLQVPRIRAVTHLVQSRFRFRRNLPHVVENLRGNFREIRLSQQFQYQGDEPFADMYPANALYFQALRGENIAEALVYFKNKAEMLDAQYHGYAPIETYIDLLARLGRHNDALAAAMKFGLGSIQPLGSAPPLVELASRCGDFSLLLAHCRQKEDLQEA